MEPHGDPLKIGPVVWQELGVRSLKRMLPHLVLDPPKPVAPAPPEPPAP